MTKPISRKMAVDCLLHRVHLHINTFIPCSICWQPLHPEQEIEFDHVHADVFGGEHKYQNLRPVHKLCHREKSIKDVKDNAKVKRIAAGGRKRKGPKIKSRGFSKVSKPFLKRIKNATPR